MFKPVGERRCSMKTKAGAQCRNWASYVIRLNGENRATCGVHRQELDRKKIPHDLLESLWE